ncbi:MAG TPA: hypothetical protein VM578_06470 [Candidatus Saccharimonadales bacterium]|nr:hypothetical protein [Candidatus Saccharimonadales bacterium]
MKALTAQAAIAASEPRNTSLDESLSKLSTAISKAIDALVAWNIPAFDAAVERQRELSDLLALHPEWSQRRARELPNAAAVARNIQRLNLVYERLLQHSASWAQTNHLILQSGGDPFRSCASVHFRG